MVERKKGDRRHIFEELFYRLDQQDTVNNQLLGQSSAWHTVGTETIFTD